MARSERQKLKIQLEGAYEAIKKATEKHEQLAIEHVDFDPMLLVDRIYGEHEQKLRAVMSDDRFAAMNPICTASGCVVFVPLMAYRRPAPGVGNASHPPVLSLWRDYDYFYHRSAKFEGTTFRDTPSVEAIYRGLALQIAYPKGVARPHMSHYVNNSTASVRRPNEGFFCTPGTLQDADLYYKVCLRFKRLYDLMMLMQWQREFTKAFVYRLQTVGQVKRLWPELSQLFDPQLAALVQHAKPSQPPKSLREGGTVTSRLLNDTAGLRSTLGTIMDTYASGQIITNGEDTRPPDLARIKYAYPCWIRSGVLELNW